MALHTIDITIQNGVNPITNPLVVNFALGEAFLKQIIVDFENDKLGFRISDNGLILLPWPGAGLSGWLSFPQRIFTFEDFRRLAGPPYALTLEAYNADTLPRRMVLYFITYHANYYPVNRMEVIENPVPKKPQPSTPQGAY